MKKLLLFPFCLLSLGICYYTCHDSPDASVAGLSMQELFRGFSSPPNQTKPWVYWYWISDNISQEGISKDLECMSKLGIGTALIGNIFLQDIPRGEVPVLSDEWYSAISHAMKEGHRLGVDIGLFNGPGWVQSGGPWIDSSYAMRYLDFSSIEVTGPGLLDKIIQVDAGHFQDIACLAYPIETEDLENSNIRISTNIPVGNSTYLMDDDLKSGINFPVKAMQSSGFTVNIGFPQKDTFRSLILVPQPEPFSVDVELQVWEKGQFRSLGRCTMDRSNPMPTVGPISFGPEIIAFDQVVADSFKIIFSGLNKQSVWFTDVERNGGMSEIRLTRQVHIENYIQKQLGKMYQLPTPSWQDYQWKQQIRSNIREGALEISRVRHLDSTEFHNGKVQWQVPEGRWRLVRFGMRPTGVTNAPVSSEALGLDVDKMNRKFLRIHFDSYLGPLLEKLAPSEKQAWKYLVVDSYETGSQNWTDGLEQAFIEKYGYNPVPWFPVLSGLAVETPELSDRFLWDLRRLVADKISSEYVGGLAEIAHRNELKLWVENYGHWGFPGEFIQYGSQADLLAGEFWFGDDLGEIECQAAVSASHILGKSQILAESYTSARMHYQLVPESLRKRGDWSFATGINHQVLHVYIHQDTEKSPGINAWFGTEFNRHNIWFPYAKSWIDYLRRNHFLLQQGVHVADICYYIGEGAPLMTGIKEPPLPKGYASDFINTDALLEMEVKNHLLTLPGGANYQLLVMPPLKSMSPAILKKVKELVFEGGNILGNPPERAPGLAGYPDSDQQVKQLADEIWANCDGVSVKIRNLGKGKIFRGMGIEETMEFVKIAPDVELPDTLPVLWNHRKTGKTELYFLSNQSDSTQDIEVIFRAIGFPQLWDAVTGRRSALIDFIRQGRRTKIPLIIEPGQSYYIVFSEDGIEASQKSNFPVFQEYLKLDGTWTVTFDTALGGPDGEQLFNQLTDWSHHENQSIRYYSGPATYRIEFQIDTLIPEKRLLLSLGQVHQLAEVRLNGREIGSVWTKPADLTITGLSKGMNQLEIKVINTWVNRLIGDSALPTSERSTWTAVNPYQPDDTLTPSGLIGPVRILIQVD